MRAPLDTVVADVMRLCDMRPAGRQRIAYRNRLARRYTHDQLLVTLRQLARVGLVDATSIETATLTGEKGKPLYIEHSGIVQFAGELVGFEEAFTVANKALAVAKETRNDARAIMLHKIEIGETYVLGAVRVKTTQRYGRRSMDVDKAIAEAGLVVTPELEPLISQSSDWVDWDVKRIGEAA